jgi:probable HAF family extracellular repeat protein
VGDAVNHGFVWRHGRMTDIGTLTGPTGYSSAEAINIRGDIVGTSRTSIGEFHAFKWHRGRMTDLGTLGGTVSTPTGINDRGDIVGYSTTPAEQYHGFVWRHGRMTDLGTAEGEFFGSAEAINNRGQIVGESGGPVVWHHRAAMPLQLVPDAVHGSALDNNNRGDIVGYSLFAGGLSTNRAVIWHRGVPTDLGLQGGSSQAMGVNDRGQVVGWREPIPNETNTGFLWHRGTVTDLPSLIGVGGSASAINNRGEIVGTSPTGEPYGSHAVLWH